ncbi:GNAT family acetyltransferase [Bacillus freudenreichii]|nr:GNAT family acetyltransferase [Bacillus freudenreichii]
MLKIKKLSDVPIRDACEAWNNGFMDYYVKMQMSVSQFTFRLGWDELSPDYSFIAYYNEIPAGIILNGITDINGKRLAWNGGTSVAASFRKQGIAKKLMESSLEIYRRENVDIATLEAFTVNQAAIRLYESFGYRVVDQLLFLKKTKPNEKSTFTNDKIQGYTLHRGLPQDVSELSFYQHGAPWKTQWKYIRGGESIIVKDRYGEAAGYILYQNIRGKDGKTILFQCEADERLPAKSEIIQLMIGQLFKTDSRMISTYNLPRKNHLLINNLVNAGFIETFTDQKIPLKQVFMKKTMNETTVD